MHSRRLLGYIVGALLSAACSASSDGTDGVDGDGGDDGPGNGSSTGNGFTTGTSSGGGDPGADCAEQAKLIYVVSVDYELYSFNPEIDGLAAYKPVGPLSCPSAGAPQSMAVNRAGEAFVFYDTGELFRVSTLDASCSGTSYVHPVDNGFNQLGMGFTAAAPESADEVLYIVSPDFGLATVAFPSMEVTQIGSLVGAAELTGGPDAKLFHFAAQNAALGEVSLGAFNLQPIHTFNELAGTSAWAFSRYAGDFYMFTSPGVGIPSKTTKYDPVTDTSTVRDQSVGITIVGAGQSTCVPPPPPT